MSEENYYSKYIRFDQAAANVELAEPSLKGPLAINQLSPATALAHLERIRRERELAQTFVRWNKSKEPQERAELWQQMFTLARELETSNGTTD